MKYKTYFSFFIFLCSFILVIASVFAISGSSSDGSVSTKNGGISTTAARGDSSDNSVSGRTSTTSPGGSSSYTDSTGAVTGSFGPDLSLTDTTTSTPSTTPTSEDQDEGGNIPSAGGGGGGGGSTSSSAESGSSSEAETSSSQEASSETTSESTTEQQTQTTETSQTAPEPVSVAIELSQGSSLSLSPATGVSEMTVLAVTETSATIIIDGSASSNQLTGGAVVGAQQETTLQVGESIDVDTDGDGIADLQVTLSKIIYDEASQKYNALFTTTYLHPTEETRAFIQQQVDSGEVALVSGAERLSETQIWTIIFVGLLVLFVLFVVILSLYDKKRKKLFPLSQERKINVEAKFSKEEAKTPAEKSVQIKPQSPSSHPLLMSSRSLHPLLLLPSPTKSPSVRKIISKSKKRKKQRQNKLSKKKSLKKSKLRSRAMRNKKNRRIKKIR